MDEERHCLRGLSPVGSLPIAHCNFNLHVLPSIFTSYLIET